MQHATKPIPNLAVAIVALEHDLQTEDAFDELECARTLDFPVPTYIDPDEETTGIYEVTNDGIHEIRPSKLTSWVNEGIEVFWVSFC
jgi:hypothetical protein